MLTDFALFFIPPCFQRATVSAKVLMLSPPRKSMPTFQTERVCAARDRCWGVIGWALRERESSTSIMARLSASSLLNPGFLFISFR